MDRRLTRSRWAAIGAAVAVTLGGGGLIGVSAASGDAASFVSVDPTRILDTRTTTKVDDSTALLQVTGEVTTYSAAGASASKTLVIPATATAVAVNVTVTQGERNGDYGFVTAYPCDAATDAAPSASTLNFVEGVDVANGVVVPLGDDGAMCLSVYGAAHLIVDVSGYYTAASAGAVDAYTKAETDDLLDDKADAASVYTATETDDLLDAKADATSVYTEDETDALLNDKANVLDPLTTTHSGFALQEVGSPDDDVVIRPTELNHVEVYVKDTLPHVFVLPVDAVAAHGSTLNSSGVDDAVLYPVLYELCFDGVTNDNLAVTRSALNYVVEDTSVDGSDSIVAAASRPSTHGDWLCTEIAATDDQLQSMIDLDEMPISWSIEFSLRNSGTADANALIEFVGARIVWERASVIESDYLG
jgi:hypothetical protein